MSERRYSVVLATTRTSTAIASGELLPGVRGMPVDVDRVADVRGTARVEDQGDADDARAWVRARVGSLDSPIEAVLIGIAQIFVGVPGIRSRCTGRIGRIPRKLINVINSLLTFFD